MQALQHFAKATESDKTVKVIDGYKVEHGAKQLEVHLTIQTTDIVVGSILWITIKKHQIAALLSLCFFSLDVTV